MVSALYYALIMLVMPFYFENKYFNLTMAKARFLWVVGGILFLAMAACYIQGMVAMISQHRQTVITREYVKQKKEKKIYHVRRFYIAFFVQRHMLRLCLQDAARGILGKRRLVYGYLDDRDFGRDVFCHIPQYCIWQIYGEDCDAVFFGIVRDGNLKFFPYRRVWDAPGNCQ